MALIAPPRLPAWLSWRLPRAGVASPVTLSALAVLCILWLSQMPQKEVEVISSPSGTDDPQLLKALQSPLGQVAERLAGEDRFIILVTLNGAFLNLVQNWFVTVAKYGHGSKVLFVAEDEKAEKLLLERWPNQFVYVHKGEKLEGNENRAAYGSAYYRALVDRRHVYIRTLLDLNFTVWFTDPDTVWLQDPFPYFQGDYDVLVAADSVKFDGPYAVTPGNRLVLLTIPFDHLCGCFVLARPTEGGKALITAWQQKVQEERVKKGKSPDDQLLWNEVVTARETIKPGVKVAILPTRLFPSGCVFFGRSNCPVHEEYRNGTLKPVIVHNNWLSGIDLKEKRFKAHNLWFLPETAPSASGAASTGTPEPQTGGAVETSMVHEQANPVESSQPNPLLAKSFAAVWDMLRLNLMWPAEGLNPRDTAGGINKDQAAEYARLVLSLPSPPKVICETGFFRGGSTLFWLLLAPEAHVHTFDLAFPEAAQKFLAEYFPGRVTYHQGSTVTTVPEFVKQVLDGKNKSCDFISVDGSHTGRGPYEDIHNLAQAASPAAILVADDTFNCRSNVKPTCPKEWHASNIDTSEGFHRNVESGVLELIHCTDFNELVLGRFRIGYCAGRVKSPATSVKA